MHSILRKLIIANVLLLCFQISTRAQMLIGTMGQMNIPTADMRKGGTFDGGIRFLQHGTTHGVYNFDTGIYYINFTPFDFIEVTFRETLLRTQHSVSKKMGYYQQDRSSTIRLRPIAESKWCPAIIIGVNDIYSPHGDSFYTAAYGVATKHFDLGNIGRLGFTAGYAKPFKAGKLYKGCFGGIDYAPFNDDRLHIMADYDTQAINVGAACQFWRSLNIFAYTSELKSWAAGISYQHTIKF